jgi:calcium/calmodulin-dependent protein kinase (CaM kinase) II
MVESQVAELLALNQRLLDAIAAGDWAVYESLCDPTLSAFEPEAHGQLVEGLAFHRFYFQPGFSRRSSSPIMASAKVRVMGDTAVVTYARLNQVIAGDGTPATSAFEETRVWHRQDGTWRHVHFHRSRIEGRIWNPKFALAPSII